MSDVESKEGNRRNKNLDQKEVKDVDGSLSLPAAAKKREEAARSFLQQNKNHIPQVLKNAPESKSKDKQVGESKNEQREKRKTESPDLKDAIEQLKPQVLSFKKFLDGSYHEKQFNEETKVITIATLQTAVDALNRAIQSYRDQGKKVRAVDLWGAVLQMPATPDFVTILPPVLSGPMLFKYLESTESFHSTRTMYIRIDSNVSIVQVDPKRPDTLYRQSNFDTLLFRLRETGKLDKESVKYLHPLVDEMDYWQAIDKRAREYGFDVFSENGGSTRDTRKDYHISIDLQSKGWDVSEGRYLRIEASWGDYEGAQSRVNVSFRDRKGFK